MRHIGPKSNVVGDLTQLYWSKALKRAEVIREIVKRSQVEIERGKDAHSSILEVKLVREGANTLTIFGLPR